MILNKLMSRITLPRIQTSLMCRKSELLTDTENVEYPEENAVRRRIRKPPIKGHKGDINKFFETNQHLLQYQEFIPNKLLHYRTRKTPEYLFLLCPKIAKKVASHVLESVQKNDNQLVCESNPGFAFVTNELLKSGVNFVRLYEPNAEFQVNLNKMYEADIHHLELFNKDFFMLYRYSYMDSQDQGNRVASLLNRVPKKSWTDDPVMTVVGPMLSLNFIKYLIKSIVLQKDIALYGRIEMFVYMVPGDWSKLVAIPENKLINYKSWTVLFNMFFEQELLEKFSRKYFLPWQRYAFVRQCPSSLDIDSIYFVKIKMKKKLLLTAEEFMPFYYFIKMFYGNGNKSIIPVVERWMPGCGLNMILPRLKEHKENFPDIGLDTKFRNLTPSQIHSVFKEVLAHPVYATSPFMDMIENELIKTDTIETKLHEANQLEKSIVKDIENKMEFQ